MQRTGLGLDRLLFSVVPLLLMGFGSSSNTDAPQQAAERPATGMIYMVPGDQGRDATRALSSNSFTGWQRYPAEERDWLTMSSPTAYSRDVMVGGETFISGAIDGETWTATAVSPVGATRNWGAITFHTDYNGQKNCFVSSFWTICDTTSLSILWYMTSQCADTGTWTMKFLNNGVQFHEGTFKILPQIPPGKVPLHNQLAYSDHYDNQCKKASDPKRYVTCDAVNTQPATIAQLGCWLVGACMILGYHGVTVDPPTLNAWLNQNNGYQNGNVDGFAVARYARLHGTNVYYAGRAVTSALSGKICSRGPQLAHVRKFGRTRYHHFVVATGQDEQKTTYLIDDPAGGVPRNLSDKYRDIGSIRMFEGPEYVFRDNLSGIVVKFRSPGELLITDPQGRRTGIDPATGQTYDEIPGGSYEDELIEDPEEDDSGMESKSLEVIRPETGEYELTVTGTGSGTYDLSIRGYDVQSAASTTGFDDIPILPGLVHKYSFNFDKTAGSVIDVAGGFNGGGQRPRDVNRFLSYVTISENRVKLPVGTTTFSLLIVYGSKIIPASFQAVLEGVDVSSLFSPAAGASELVDIPLHGGQNVLTLSVQGNLPGRVARDTDRIVFLVGGVAD